MTFTFHPEARFEFNEAIAYYEKAESGLGVDFAEEIYAAIQRILKYPDAWSPLSKNTRRCLTDRFPFGVIYQIRDEEILIVAIAHLSREPEYWENRL